MTTVADWITIDAETAAASLRRIAEVGPNKDAQLRLDLSQVKRIDEPTLTALGALAFDAESLHSQIVLRGVNADIYKVMKLMNVAQRFQFVS